jgi:hypothetical protein
MKKTDNRAILKIREFEAIMLKYRNFGAEDSEPRYEFRKTMTNFFKGKDFYIPASARAWQLYSSMEGSEEAALVLNRNLNKLIHTLSEMPFSEVSYAGRYFGYIE